MTEEYVVPAPVFKQLVDDLVHIANIRTKSPRLPEYIALRLRQDIRTGGRSTKDAVLSYQQSMPEIAALTWPEIQIIMMSILQRTSVGKYKSSDECRAARRMLVQVKEVLEKKCKEKSDEHGSE